VPQQSWSYEALPHQADQRQGANLVYNSLAILPVMWIDAPGLKNFYIWSKNNDAVSCPLSHGNDNTKVRQYNVFSISPGKGFRFKVS